VRRFRRQVGPPHSVRLMAEVLSWHALLVRRGSPPDTTCRTFPGCPLAAPRLQRARKPPEGLLEGAAAGAGRHLAAQWRRQPRGR
jgi:hypothetical protein